MSLPSHSLPSHALPSRALCLISEYSKPLTRPDWRQSKPLMSTYSMFVYVRPFIVPRMPFKWPFYYLCKMILANITQTEWYALYNNIQYLGMYNTSIKFNIHVQKLKQIPGLNKADNLYRNY